MTVREITTDDGVRLHTRVDGGADAPALLLCNSLGTDLSMWDDQVGPWSRRRRVIRFDQRGHGRSDAPPPPYTVERLGRDALAVLDAHDVVTTDVCGLSLGGVVGLWLAGTASHRVRRVVLADTAARVGTEEGWRQRVATVRDEGMPAIVDTVLSRFFSAGFRSSDDPWLDRMAQHLRGASVDGYTGSCEALATADLTDLARSVSAPALVVVGTADEATPPDDARTLAALLPDARLVELPGAGHLANLEQPERFGQLVADFLDAARAA